MSNRITQVIATTYIECVELVLIGDFEDGEQYIRLVTTKGDHLICCLQDDCAAPEIYLHENVSRAKK